MSYTYINHSHPPRPLLPSLLSKTPLQIPPQLWRGHEGLQFMFAMSAVSSTTLTPSPPLLTHCSQGLLTNVSMFCTRPLQDIFPKLYHNYREGTRGYSACLPYQQSFPPLQPPPFLSLQLSVLFHMLSIQLATTIPIPTPSEHFKQQQSALTNYSNESNKFHIFNSLITQN